MIAGSDETGVSAPVASGRYVMALAAAFLAGAAGLALESLLVASSGLALGYGGSAAIGLAVWLAAWALGSWALGARGLGDARPRRRLAAVGVILALVGPLSVWTVLQAGDGMAGSVWAAPLALLSIAATAFLQGAFLPILAQGNRSVAGLFSANLFGSLLGAYAIADVAVGSLGRVPAAWIAALAALVAGAIGALSLEQRAFESSRARAVDHALALSTAGWIIGLGAAWMSAGEWVLLRLGVLWLGGMQNALNAVLCASLLSLAVGAALVPRIVPRGARGVWVLLVACAFASLWPFVAAPFLRDAANAPFFVRALVLCGPALLPFGAIVPVVHASTGLARDGGERLGRLLLHEAWGAALGIPLVHFLVVPRFGLWAAIAAGLALGTLALAPLWKTSRRDRIAALSLLLLASAACAYASSQPTLARASPPLSNPALSIQSLREDRDFAVAVVDDGVLGERTLLTDGFRAAGTGRDYRYMEALGHLPVLLHPDPRRVAVLALGTGTTLGAVALHPEVERIDVLEISRAVVEAAPWFVEKNHGALSEGLPGLLDEHDGNARIVVHLGDGRATLATQRGAYDVITMEPLLPDSPFAVYLYTREFYTTARRALRPGGIVCQWVPPHALEPRTFDAVLDAFAASFGWSGVWLSGTQVLLVGCEHTPALLPARFPDNAGALRAALVDLGLASAGEVAARWCGALAPSPGTSRILRDADPWIVFRPRRFGIELLWDLPRNLARLRELGARELGAGDLPPEWSKSLGPADRARIAGMRDLRRAREAQAWMEAQRPNIRPDTEVELESSLARARLALDADPELVRFENEVSFLDHLRQGYARLASGAGAEAAVMALEDLLSAKEARPERRDVDLYVAVALERSGDARAAESVLAQALAACPKLRSTSAGAHAFDLGLSDTLWSRAAERARQPSRGAGGVR